MRGLWQRSTLRRRSSRGASAIGLGVVLLVASAGCGKVAPAGAEPGGRAAAGHDGGSPPQQRGSGPGAGVGGSSSVLGPSAPRTTEWRSPFGDVTPGNLLVNGDFEWGIGVPAPGWYAVADTHVMPFRYRTGGACRSGLLCAEIAGGQTLVATMLSLPAAGLVTVRGYARPRSGPCSSVSVTLVAETFHLAGTTSEAWQLTPPPPSPAEDPPAEGGFCVFAGSFPIDGPHDYASLSLAATDATVFDAFSVRTTSVGTADAESATSPPGAEDAPETDRVRDVTHLITAPVTLLQMTHRAREHARRERSALPPPSGRRTPRLAPIAE